MAQDTTLHIQLRRAVVRQVAALANQEGRDLAEMARILLEDALALRQTIESAIQANKPCLHV